MGRLRRILKWFLEIASIGKLGILSGMVIGRPICLPKRMLALILIGFGFTVFLIVLGISLHQNFHFWLCRALCSILLVFTFHDFNGFSIFFSKKEKKKEKKRGREY
jgi:ABC-type multidrug transport system permease subunit